MAKYNPAVPTGPIPGENYTSDTKNYPWHRPPDITSIDKGIEASIKQLASKQGSYGLLNMLQMGVSVCKAAEMFVMSGIGSGKWTPDFAILIAGPIAKMMKIMADGAGIKYDMGLEDDPIPTISFYEGLKKVDTQSVSHAQEAAANAMPEIKSDIANAKTDTPSKGFASPPIAAPTGTPIQSSVPPYTPPTGSM